MNTAAIVQVCDLSKSFNGAVALQNINLQIKRGSITGFVGANGAGKSTLMQVMTGIHVPSAGTCLTLGQPADKLDASVLKRIGYVHQEGALVPWMSVRRLIRFVAGHYPGRWNSELEQAYIRRFKLPLDVRVSTLSPGKRQQLAILLAVGYEPELLILDEPAAGLDPLARYEFLQLLLDMIQSDERTIIISSHILSDIEQIIDHVVIFEDASVLRDCEFDVLCEEFVKLFLTSKDGDLDISGIEGAVVIQQQGGQAMVVLRRSVYDSAVLGRQLNCDIRELPLNFESVYRLVVAPQSFSHTSLEQDA